MYVNYLFMIIIFVVCRDWKIIKYIYVAFEYTFADISRLYVIIRGEKRCCLV